MSEFITELDFDSKSLWQPKGFEPNPFPEKTWPLIKELDLKSLTQVEGEDLKSMGDIVLSRIRGVKGVIKTLTCMVIDIHS